MKLKFKNKTFEPEDAREAFFKNEKQQVRNKKIGKWLFYFMVLVALAVIIFVLYAYFIDKPDVLNVSLVSSHEWNKGEKMAAEWY